MTSTTARLHKNRSPVRARSGPASYAGTGGPGRQRLCAAAGQLPHGHTPV